MSLSIARCISRYTCCIPALDPTRPANGLVVSSRPRRRTTSAFIRSASIALDTSRYTYRSPITPPGSPRARSSWTAIFMRWNRRGSGAASVPRHSTTFSTPAASAHRSASSRRGSRNRCRISASTSGGFIGSSSAALRAQQLLVPAVREHQALARVEHRHRVSGGVQHCLQPPVAARQLPPVPLQIALHVPLLHQRERDLLHLLARKRLPDVQQLVQQLHVADDLRQRLVRVRGHDDQLDLRVDRPHPPDRLHPVHAGRHADVHVGDGHRPARRPASPHQLAPLLPAAGMQQLELRQKVVPPLLTPHERRRQIVARPRRTRPQHLREVVVDALLVIDDQHAPVGLPRGAPAARPAMRLHHRWSPPPRGPAASRGSSRRRRCRRSAPECCRRRR